MDVHADRREERRYGRTTDQRDFSLSVLLWRGKVGDHEGLVSVRHGVSVRHVVRGDDEGKG